MVRALAAPARRPSDRRQRPRSLSGNARDRGARTRGGDASTATAARIEVDLSDNLDCLPCGLNLSEATARTAAMIGIFNGIGASVPPNAGSFRRIGGPAPRQLRGRHSPPSHELLARHHEPRRPGHQRRAGRARAARRRPRHGRARRHHERRRRGDLRARRAPAWRALRQPDDPGPDPRRRLADGGRLAHDPDPGNGGHVLVGQRRDRRAPVSDSSARAPARSRQRRRRTLAGLARALGGVRSGRGARRRHLRGRRPGQRPDRRPGRPRRRAGAKLPPSRDG